MTEYNQTFTPAIKFYKGADLQEKEIFSKTLEEMGAYVIEEVWKYYDKDIWVSNYGYVARIPTEKAKEVFGDDLEKFKTEGVIYRNARSEQKYLIKNCNEVPANFYKYFPEETYVDRLEIMLYVEFSVGGYECVHIMVAERFLGHKKGNGYEVHHIDNNSYNNSVVNLICLPPGVHKTEHKKLHPMSYR